MSSEDDEAVPLSECALPGTLTVTDRAIGLAKRFQAAVPSGYIVAFSWYDWGKSRANKDAPWVETGPGLDLGAYKIHQIPQAAVWSEDTFRFAVLIRPDVLAAHPAKTIDFNSAGKVVLE